MKTHAHCERSFQFSFPKLDTLVLVQELDDSVVIRASRDSFSEQGKVNFIRELAAEGFIADCFQWSCVGIRWLVDASWLKPAATARSKHFIVRLWVGSVVLWVMMISALFLCEYLTR